MWSKVFLLVLDDRGAALRDSVKSYRKRYNIDSNREVNIREVIVNGGCTGKEFSDVTIDDKLIVIAHADARYLRAQKIGLMSPFEFVELLSILGLKEVGIISFKCCYLGAKSYLEDIKNELYSDIKIGYMSAYKRSAVTIFGHEGVGFIDSMIRLISAGLLKLPDRWRVNFVRGNTQAPRYSGKRAPGETVYKLPRVSRRLNALRRR
ncbi:TPA: hypothetical protein J1W43_004730 [Escherichia coli]|nr:hypothetical protein [Escherichia coli]HBA8271091.1 hypothetical protein [Escherichia coli]HBA8733700.1 hypothetical protein [Escherichia coli]HBB8629766.1 hypothetical protein [Escherichia coli]